MTAILPDRPIVSTEDDLLGRAEFAANLASLIANAPTGSTLRIGVYGTWGEGKTSVLQMMRAVLVGQGSVCVWIVPWLASSSSEMAAQVTREIATALGISLNKADLTKKAQKLLGKARSVADIDPRAKAADAFLGPALEWLLGKGVDHVAEALAAEIRRQLGQRKLIVFVDDLDRVRPEFVPTLLLTLREALDRPDFYYVLGLAPEVVERGLAAVHEGWGEPRQFLEKIVELPRYVPRATEAGRKQFIAALVAAAGAAVDVEALHEIVPYLPHNPRRIKLFIRYISSFGDLLARFAPSELDHRCLYLAQLLKMEFPGEVDALVLDAEALHDIESGSMRERNMRLVGISQSTEKEFTKLPEMGHIAADHPEKARFAMLCGAIRERMLNTSSKHGLRLLLELPDVRPAFTDSEVGAIANAWLEEPESTIRTAAINQALDQISAKGSENVRLLWSLLLARREEELSEAIGMSLQSELFDGLKRSSRFLDLLKEIAGGPHGYKTQRLGSDEWSALLNHVAKWSHFVRLEEHKRLRERERQLLLDAFSLLSNEQKGTMLWLLHAIPTFDGAHEPNFDAVLRTLQDESANCAIADALALFVRADGMDSVTGAEADLARKRILFDATSPLHASPHHFAELAKVARRADGDSAIQLNFLSYLRLLVFGATEGGSFSIPDCRALLSKPDMLRLLWDAAVVRPLNPRIAGSLRQHRMALGAWLGDLSSMPLPDWWQELKISGFFNSETA